MTGPELTALEGPIARATKQIVYGLAKRQRPSEEGIRRFSEDVALVAAGVRQGFYVVRISDPILIATSGSRTEWLIWSTLWLYRRR